MPLDLSTVNRTHLANTVGVDLGHVSRILSGKAKPSIDLAVRMAHALGVSLDELCVALGIAPESEPAP